MLVDSDACSDPSVSVVYPRPGGPASGISVGLVEVTIRCNVSDRGIDVVQSGSREQVVTAVASIDFFRASGAP